jgi:hypothetical protein
MVEEAEDIHGSNIDSEQYSFEEVEGIISNKDDPSMLGFLLATIRCFYETYMDYRTIPTFLEPLCYYALAYPFGKLMSLILPCRTWTRWRFSLNPGPFTIKEHALAGIIAFSTDPLVLIGELAMKRLFSPKEHIHSTLALLYVISILLLGFGLAGEFLI